MSAPFAPPELTALRRWLPWDLQPGSNGKPTKVPRGSTTNPATWLSFEETCAASGASGVGFVFTDTQYAGIDLDQCFVDGEPTAAAMDIITALPGYVEVSPSGVGLHAIVRGKLPPGVGCQNVHVPGMKKLEAYNTGRFFTWTGNVFAGRDTIGDDGTTALGALAAKWLRQASDVRPLSADEARARLPEQNAHLTDDELLLLVEDADPTGYRHYIEGELPPTHPSSLDESQGDVVLLRKLIKYVGWNEDRLEVLARRSTRQRERWDRRHSGGLTWLRYQIRRELRHAAAVAKTTPHATESAIVRSMAEYLKDPDALRPPVAVIPRLAWPTRIVACAAPAGTGKSTIYKAGAAALTRGRAFLGMPTVTGGGTVLWARCEESEYDLYGNLALFDPDPERFFAFRPGTEPVRQIVDEVRARRPTVMVTDSMHQLLLMAGVRDFNDAAAVGAVFEPIEAVTRETGTAMVWLYKANREGTTRNSSEFLHTPDLVYEARRERGSNVLELSVAKERFEIRAFDVALDGTTYSLVEAGVISEAQEALDARVWEWIREHPDASGGAVRTGIGGNVGAVDGAVRRLLEGRARRIVNLGSRTRPKYRVGDPLPEI